MKIAVGLSAGNGAAMWFRAGRYPPLFLLADSRKLRYGRSALGLIERRRRTELAACSGRFLEKKHFEPLSFQGARIPVYTGWVPVDRAVGGGKVYLVGDAAGQVKVTTVGGIVTGVRGAEGVAEAILNGGRSRKLSSLRRELNLHLLIRRALHHFQQADYSRLVDLLNSSAKTSLSTYTRDEAARVLWHICRNQPRLLLLGLRGLLMPQFDRASSKIP